MFYVVPSVLCVFCVVLCLCMWINVGYLLLTVVPLCCSCLCVVTVYVTVCMCVCYLFVYVDKCLCYVCVCCHFIFCLDDCMLYLVTLYYLHNKNQAMNVLKRLISFHRHSICINNG